MSNKPYDLNIPIPEALHGKHQKLLIPLVKAPHGASVWLPKRPKAISGACQKLFGPGGYRSQMEIQDGVAGARVWRLRP